jgi:hypothetical protein
MAATTRTVATRASIVLEACAGPQLRFSEELILKTTVENWQEFPQVPAT